MWQRISSFNNRKTLLINPLLINDDQQQISFSIVLFLSVKAWQKITHSLLILLVSSNVYIIFKYLTGAACTGREVDAGAGAGAGEARVCAGAVGDVGDSSDMWIGMIRSTDTPLKQMTAR